MKIIKKTIVILLSILFVSCFSSQKKKIDDPDLLYRIGEDYLKKGAFVQALQALFDAEKLDPKNHEIKNLIGFTFMVRGDYENSEKYYKKAISVKNDYPEAHIGIADVYIRLKKWDKAIHHADEALSNILYMSPYEAYNIRGWANFNKADYNSAEVDFRNAISSNPNYVVAIYNLGLVYEKKKMYSPSSNQFLQAIEICGRCQSNFLSDLHFRAAETLWAAGEKETANEHYKKCWELNPKYLNAEKCRSKASN